MIVNKNEELLNYKSPTNKEYRETSLNKHKHNDSSHRPIIVPPTHNPYGISGLHSELPDVKYKLRQSAKNLNMLINLYNSEIGINNDQLKSYTFPLKSHKKPNKNRLLAIVNMLRFYYKARKIVRENNKYFRYLSIKKFAFYFDSENEVIKINNWFFNSIKIPFLSILLTKVSFDISNPQDCIFSTCNDNLLGEINRLSENQIDKYIKLEVN